MNACFRERSRGTVMMGLVMAGLFGLSVGEAVAQTTIPGPEGAFRSQPHAFKQDTVEFKLAPGEGMEYKYRIEEGGTLLFSWTSTGPVHYELHSERDDGPRGQAESFDLDDDSDGAHGSYLALFPGIHGWYWENRANQEVTIRLTSAGFFTHSLEYRRGEPPQIKEFD